MLIHSREYLKQLLESYRFIDDVDMKWSQSDEELQNFLSRANNLHPSIKFTHEISNTTLSFLDTSSPLSEGELSTDLYSKPTYTNQYLLPSSCHPPHVTKSIPYSQALRIRRICSTDKSLEKRLGQLKHHMKRRGYKQSIIKKSFIKAHNISRSSLLQYKEEKKCKRTSNAHEFWWICFSDRDGMWRHKGVFYISFLLCTEVNCSWRCYELWWNFS
jgi:peptide-methionine (R)-S-oxide reductase